MTDRRPLPDLSHLARTERIPVGQVRDLIFGIIRYAITHDPRSLQVELGPSEIGQECERRLGYKLAHVDECNARGVPWRPFIGRAGHDKLEEIFIEANAGVHPVMWLAETEVDTGELVVGGRPQRVRGHSDLMALIGGTVVDWKFVGSTSLKKYKRNRHPGRQYRDQAHGYGVGFAARGLPIDDVAICFLPTAGELSDAYWWSEPFNPDVWTESLARAQRVQNAVELMGADVLQYLAPSEDNCRQCPFYMPGSTDIARGCPGVEPAPEPKQPAGSVFA